MAKAAAVGVHRSLTVWSVSRSVDNFKLSTIKPFLAIARDVAGKCGKDIFGTEVLLTFVKSGYLISGYIPTIRDAKWERRFIKEPVGLERRVQKVFATGRLGLPGDKENSLVSVHGADEERDGLMAASVSLFF